MCNGGRPAETGPALPASPATPGTDDGLGKKRTSVRALSYDPGEVRVRLTAIRDYISVLRSRYMDSIFRIACLLVLVHLVWSSLDHWQAQATGATVSYSELRVSDACALLASEASLLGPLLLVLVASYLLRKRNAVYLLDFTLFEPPADWRVSKSEIRQMLRNAGEAFSEADIEFQSKVLDNSGTGEATAWPPGIIRCLDKGQAQDQSVAASRAEADAVICGCLEKLFETTGVKPKQVDGTPDSCVVQCRV